MAGFFKYLLFIARRERVMSSIWIGLTVALTFLIALIFPSLLGDETSKIAMVEMLKSPAMVGMLGPSFDADSYTVGMAFSHMMTIWVMITVAVMNIFFINRHTRVDEEHGRLEMLRSLPLGRLTNAVASITASVLLNLGIASLSVFAIMIAGFEGCSLAGAIVYSLEIAMFGILMAGISLVSAQLFSTARGSSIMAFGLLGLFYLMRIAGDYTDNVISYISPMGLGLRVFAFHENNVYPIIIQLVLSVLLVVLALALDIRRDLGEGIIPAKKGRAEARQSLLSPLGFVLRLTKASTIIWGIVVFVVGAMYGSMLGDIESFVEGNDFFKQFLAYDEGMVSSLTESYLAVLFLVMAHIAVIPVILTAVRIRSEESRGRMEQIFARSVNRTEFILLFALTAFIESILFLFCAVLGLYSTSFGVDAVSFASLLAMGMCYLPAMWFFAGLGILITGAFPKGGVAVWLLYAYSFAVTYLGQMLNLPDFFKMLSAFNAIPQLPVQDFSVLPIILLTIISIATVGLGIWRFAKRDMGSV